MSDVQARNVPSGGLESPLGGEAAQATDTSGSAIPDVLANGLRVLFCGINPGRVSAAARAHFANPRNDFWRLLHAAGFTTTLLEPDRQWAALDDGIGITNAAQRTTPGSGDLRRSDFAGAAERLKRIALELHPAWIAFVGKEAYRGTFGERPQLGSQRRTLGGTKLFVLPSTSPANAAVPWDERLRWFTALAQASQPVVRPAARAIVIDDESRVLMHRFVVGNDPGVWVTPGGAVDPGEDEKAALARELEEELTLRDVEIGSWVWRRRHVWAWKGIVYDTREQFALVRGPLDEIQPTNHDSFFAGDGAEEQWRWWSVDELAASDEEFAPRRIAELLPDVLAGNVPSEPIDVGV
jgi:double-stranded uracil-DNA glycosylase